jgi:hypothetical protein
VHECRCFPQVTSSQLKLSSSFFKDLLDVEGEAPLQSISVEFGREEWKAVCIHLYPIFPRPDLTMVSGASRTANNRV